MTVPEFPGADSESFGDPRQTQVNLGSWQQRSRANGPGQRFVLWVQGCRQRCPGCVNQQFLPRINRHLVSVAELTDKILAVGDIEGVTYSGGEPMLQARGLALLSRQLQAAGLSVVCYTGYTLESLRERNDHWVTNLLDQVDILIDGPYRRDQAVALPWRSSRNQQVHLLTNRYRHLAAEINRPGAEVEFFLGGEGFTTTGNWPEGFLERLQEHLRR